MTYFIPDRSNRPGDYKELFSTSIETPPSKNDTRTLADGRIAIVEGASIDSYYVVTYYYFDAIHLEDLTLQQLSEFMKTSDITWQENSDGYFTFLNVNARLIEDAQQRPIWEFSITYSMDD